MMNRRATARRCLLPALLGLLALFAFPAARGAANPGEILLGEMNCAACHDAPAPVRERLASRQGPVLGERGRRITPQWLRAFLLNPQDVQPGAVMPDSLHALPPAQKAEAADALTHYLLSIQQPDPTLGVYDPGIIARGREFYNSVGCVACHAPQETPRASDDARVKSQIDAVSRSGPSLARPEMKSTAPQLAAYLRDPLKTMPSGRMPSLNLDDAEATAIASYLLRAQAPNDAPANAPGLVYEYYEQAFTRLPNFDRLQPKTKGITAQMNLDRRERDNDFGLRFRGNLTVAAEGEYTFYTNSDDGTRLFIDDKEIIENDGIHAPVEKAGKVVLKRGDHALTLVYFDGTGERALAVSWEGPGVGKSEIPASVLTHPGKSLTPVGNDPAFAVDPARAERGRQLYASLNCAACHVNSAPSVPAAAKARAPLLGLDPARADGCTGAAPAADRPKYAITDADRLTLQTALHAGEQLTQKLTPPEQIEHTMTALNCYACHNRDGQGGPGDVRRQYFTANGDVDLGDEGRFPPHLNGVGAKLRPEAIGRILWEGAVARPYMATRMPQFGRANVEALVPAFGAADPEPPGAPGGSAIPANAAFGRKLAGTGGLACITCHNFAGHAALGVPALDMSLMYGRLKPAWFRRYLLDPQALRPGTRMPAFWPEGKALNRDILGGDTEQQIGALWQFLSKGQQAELPDGLIVGKMEISATKDTQIYRNFIRGAGPRGIGVGFQEKANLAFDADEMRIDLIWQGAFIDAARHRTGRGQGFEPPLGTNVVSWTPGAPFAVLDGPESPWPAGTGKAAGYQFKGYRLDKKQRPTFLYTFRDVRVEDKVAAAPGDPAASLKRRLSFHAEQPPEQLFYRVAVGAKIEQKGPGAFLIDDRVMVNLSSGQPSSGLFSAEMPQALASQPIVRRAKDRLELLAPITFQGQDATLEEELVW